MADFTKLATFLDSFDKSSSEYDLACFIKAKIATDLSDPVTINNGEEDDLDDNDITMSTPEQQSESNTEGDLMAGAFKELDALNKIDEEKEEVVMPGKKDSEGKTQLDVATEEAFGDNIQNQKHASLFKLLQNKIKR
jgi:hypothetical protein